jgi:P pilus assembly chaperone PapD
METKKPASGWLLGLLAAFLLFLIPSSARADLTFTPMRIVFEGRDRSATVELLNQTNRTNTYRLRWMQMTMDEKGHYELLPIDEKAPNSFDKMVIFTPRQVTIAPHGYQTIRLSLRRPADLAPGEYRAQLAMIRLAKQGPERQDPNAKSVSMDIKVNLGFSIPIIVRSGDDPGLKVALNSPKLELKAKDDPKAPPQLILKVDLARVSGKFSTFGAVHVYWDPANGPEKEIGILNKISLYPELEKRELSIPLKEVPTDGSIRLTYVGQAESEGKTWAQKSFPIGK